jgi:hypothetical protein
MPNWVFCNLSVTGEKSAVEAFDAEMRKPYPTFAYAEGEENRGYGHLDGKWTMTEGGEFSFWNAVAPTDLEAYFTGDTWYGWNSSNWGCKWDANIQDEDSYDFPSGEHQRTYRFDTAWSPPREVFVAICAKYPTLDFGLSYEEEQGWGGELDSDGEGGVVQTEEYDIPQSHADYDKRGNEDLCLCASESDPEEMYDDCPPAIEANLNENKLIPITDLTSVS